MRGLEEYHALWSGAAADSDAPREGGGQGEGQGGPMDARVWSLANLSALFAARGDAARAGEQARGHREAGGVPDAQLQLAEVMGVRGPERRAAARALFRALLARVTANRHDWDAALALLHVISELAALALDADEPEEALQLAKDALRLRYGPELLSTAALAALRLGRYAEADKYELELRRCASASASPPPSSSPSPPPSSGFS